MRGLRLILAVVVLSSPLMTGCTPLQKAQDYIASPAGQEQIETVIKKATSGDWTGVIIAGITLLASTGVAAVAGGTVASKKTVKAKAVTP